MQSIEDDYYEDNILICGLGYEGRLIADYFRKRGRKILIVDKNYNNMTEYKGIPVKGYDCLVNIKFPLTCFIGSKVYFEEIRKTLMKYSIHEPLGLDDLCFKRKRNYENLDFKTSDTPVVSIIVTAFNKWNYTYNCLQSIHRHKIDIDYELILGDDCSTDETSHAEEYFKGIRVIHNKKNMNYLGNCNKCARAAKGKYLYFLGNDTEIIHDNWIDIMLKHLTANANIAAVGGKCYLPLNPNYEINTAEVFCKDGSFYMIHDNTREAHILLVTNMLIKKEAWNRVGGYTEDYYPAYYEDLDLCLKLLDCNYKLVYVDSGCGVLHFEGISYRDRNINAAINKRKFYSKWASFISVNGVDDGFDRSRIMEKMTV